MKTSAGILLYRNGPEGIRFFLVHPGGPYFRHKDTGYWTVPKGEPAPDEDMLAAALREFGEETGYRPAGPAIPLTPVRQKGGKQVYCWAIAGDLDPAAIISNRFEIPWPPRSGRIQSFPEIDRAGWFDYEAAKACMNGEQAAFLDELLGRLHDGESAS